jgi:hypothetical protein
MDCNEVNSFFSPSNTMLSSMARLKLYVCCVNNSFFSSFFTRGEVNSVTAVDFFFSLETIFLQFIITTMASSLTNAQLKELKNAFDVFDTGI